MVALEETAVIFSLQGSRKIFEEAYQEVFHLHENVDTVTGLQNVIMCRLNFIHTTNMYVYSNMYSQ